MRTFIGSIAFIRSWMLDALGYTNGERKKTAMGSYAALALMAYFFLLPQILPKTTFPMKPPMDITASLLSQEYATNKVAAEQRFRGNVVKITGIVQRVGADDGDLAVLLEGMNSRTSVVAFLGPQQEEKAATIHQGDAVALFCGGDKIVSGNPTLRGCHIVG